MSFLSLENCIKKFLKAICDSSRQLLNRDKLNLRLELKSLKEMLHIKFLSLTNYGIGSRTAAANNVGAAIEAQAACSVLSRNDAVILSLQK